MSVVAVTYRFSNRSFRFKVTYSACQSITQMDSQELAATISRAVVSAVTAALATAPALSAVAGSSVPNTSARPPVNPAAACTPNSIIAVSGDSEDEFEQLQTMMQLGLPKAVVARNLNISRPTLYKCLAAANIPVCKYSILDDNSLDRIVREIKLLLPAAGQIMVQGHLTSQGICVQRHRLRSSLKRVDEAGIQARSLRTIRRRIYSVPGPNFLWHLDGTHKLIRWRFVIHMGIDGFSRLITFGQCSNNNRSDTVLSLFEKARSKYGNPLRVRTDEGGENVKIWNKMYTLFPECSNPVIVGSSVHNQRVERLHRDVNEQVANAFYNMFYNMESLDILNPENTTDIFCLHYVFIPVINNHLQEFILAHNSHKISTERNYTPLQLFCIHYGIRENYNEANPEFQGGMLPSALDKDLPYVDVPAISNPLSSEEHLHLSLTVDPIGYANPVDAYRDVVAFVASLI